MKKGLDPKELSQLELNEKQLGDVSGGTGNSTYVFRCNECGATCTPCSLLMAITFREKHKDEAKHNDVEVFQV